MHTNATAWDLQVLTEENWKFLFSTKEFNFMILLPQFESFSLKIYLCSIAWAKMSMYNRSVHPAEGWDYSRPYNNSFQDTRRIKPWKRSLHLEPFIAQYNTRSLNSPLNQNLVYSPDSSLVKNTLTQCIHVRRTRSRDIQHLVIQHLVLLAHILTSRTQRWNSQLKG